MGVERTNEKPPTSGEVSSERETERALGRIISLPDFVFTGRRGADPYQKMFICLAPYPPRSFASLEDDTVGVLFAPTNSLPPRGRCRANARRRGL